MCLCTVIDNQTKYNKVDIWLGWGGGYFAMQGNKPCWYSEWSVSSYLTCWLTCLLTYRSTLLTLGSLLCDLLPGGRQAGVGFEWRWGVGRTGWLRRPAFRFSGCFTARQKVSQSSQFVLMSIVSGCGIDSSLQLNSVFFFCVCVCVCVRRCVF